MSCTDYEGMRALLDIILGIDILAHNILSSSEELNMGVTVQEDGTKKKTVPFPYDPALAAKAKTIPAHKRQLTEKQRGFPDTNGTLEKILKTFEGEDIHFCPALKGSENISSLKKGKAHCKNPLAPCGHKR